MRNSIVQRGLAVNKRWGGKESVPRVQFALLSYLDNSHRSLEEINYD